jgi:DNA (cytosine-5)-methyltransferase 1
MLACVRLLISIVLFKDIIFAIAALNYKIWWKVLTTRDFGIPQSRPRVYILAIRSDSMLSEFAWPEPEPMKDIEGFLQKGAPRKTRENLGPTAAKVLAMAEEHIRQDGGFPESSR